MIIVLGICVCRIQQYSSLKGIKIIPLEINSQVRLALDFMKKDNKEDQPLLFICYIYPTEYNFQQLLQNSSCFVDWFSYQMMSSQELVFDKGRKENLISSYLNLYEYNASSFIGIQSILETDVTIEFSYKSNEECIQYYCKQFSDCKNDSECRNSYCICKEQQIGKDCHLFLDKIENQKMFQGNKMYYLDIKLFNNQDYKLRFQNTTKYQSYCIIDNMNPSKINVQENNILYITKNDITTCQSQLNQFQKQFNQTVNFYYLIYFDNGKITYLEQNYDAEDTQQLIIVLTSIIATLLFLIIVCVIKQKFKRTRIQKQTPNFEPAKQESDNIFLLVNRVCPSQEYGALITRQHKYLTQDKCSICLDQYNDGAQIRLIFCEHIFHTQCIDQWLNSHKYCPDCKSPFDIITIMMQCKSQKQVEKLQWSFRMDEVIMKNDPLVNQSNFHQSFSQVESIRNFQPYDMPN